MSKSFMLLQRRKQKLHQETSGQLSVNSGQLCVL
jgi:hypothetical protein